LPLRTPGASACFLPIGINILRFGLVTGENVTRTLSARYYKDGSEILISQGPRKNPRRLTPRECARLMGYPKDFKIPVSDTQAYKQFGNSVVVPVVERIAKAVVQSLHRRLDERPDLVLTANDRPHSIAPKHKEDQVHFIRVKHTDGSQGYYFDCASSVAGGRFKELFDLIFGHEVPLIPGNFIVRPIDSGAFSADPILAELLGLFDEVKERGWIDTLRQGDTGIGYTFETLIGIEENNDEKADFGRTTGKPTAACIRPNKIPA
jgi:hypothetical protein